MTKIDLTINFAGDDGAVRSETRSFFGFVLRELF